MENICYKPKVDSQNCCSYKDFEDDVDSGGP